MEDPPLSGAVNVAKSHAQLVFGWRDLGTNSVRIGIPLEPYGLCSLEWQRCGCHLTAVAGGFTLMPCESHRLAVLQVYDPSISAALDEVAKEAI